MATIKLTGAEELIAKLERLTNHSRGVCKMALWEGGKVVGDAIKSSLNDIPVQDHFVPKGTMRTGVTSEDKEKIINSFGLSKMRGGGTYSTKAGFNAGSKIRAVESGTSYMTKHPVVRRAINSSKAAAVSAIRQKFIEEINKLMN